MQDDGKPPNSSVDETEDTYELELGDEEGGEVADVLEAALEAVERSERRRERGSAAESQARAEESPAEAADTAADDGEEAPAADGSSDATVAKLKDHLARTLADFDNFRKRTEREKADLKRQFTGEVLKDILPVVDNLERAMAAGGSVDELKKGLEMVMRQQADVFKRWGVVPVEAVGEPFDPAVHEAVAREESSGVDVPTVTAELQKGYTINDRLLRPSMVYVTMPLPKPKKAAPEPSAETEAADEAGAPPTEEGVKAETGA